ncbi:putative dimethylaniline monooxygenase [Apostichopus japonicus]|uniref:Flavin-containing monooxygenase n=1 Tax=Stichopus japonicus TaxID=307972 RepID=A0A2G8K6B0_STIJA|nr:putative dimethylaniline monooxygenase [Apostichopus japonicus]
MVIAYAACAQSGVWIFRDETDSNPGSALYDCVVTNSSRQMMCYSDFSFPRDTPPFIPGKALLKYYQHRYRVEKTEDFAKTGQWRVTVLHEGEETVHVFDAIMPCTGFFSIINYPMYPGQDEFKGTVFHSNEYRGNEHMAGKNVVVVGGSHSAGDISVDASLTAKQVYLSMRKGTWVITRSGPGGWPGDLYMNRRINFLLPEWYRRNAMKKDLLSKINVDNLGLRCDRELFCSEVMVNDLIQSSIFCGKVKTKTGIDHFTKTGIVFTDGTEVDADVVIFATGYKLRAPYLDTSIVQEELKDLELYKYVFPPRLEHATCACIGFMMTIGATVPLSSYSPDGQCSNNYCSIGWIEAVGESWVGVDGRIPPIPYQDSLAAQIGALPSFKRYLFTDPALAFRILFGPALPCSYRLVGPHPWKGARSAIMGVWDIYSNATRTRDVGKPKPNYWPLPLQVAVLLALVALLIFAT